MHVCFSGVVRSVAWAAAGFRWVFAFLSLSACVVCQKVCVNPLHEFNVISQLKAHLQFSGEKSTSLIRYLLYSALNAWCIILCMMFWCSVKCVLTSVDSKGPFSWFASTLSSALKSTALPLILSGGASLKLLTFPSRANDYWTVYTGCHDMDSIIREISYTATWKEWGI